MIHVENSQSLSDGTTTGAGSDEVVRWPAEWSLVDNEIKVRATIPAKNPPHALAVKIDLNELHNRFFRAHLQALFST